MAVSRGCCLAAWMEPRWAASKDSHAAVSMAGSMAVSSACSTAARWAAQKAALTDSTKADTTVASSAGSKVARKASHWAGWMAGWMVACSAGHSDASSAANSVERWDAPKAVLMAAAKVAVRASLTAGCWAEMELRENGQGFNAGEDKRKNKRC